MDREEVAKLKALEVRLKAAEEERDGAMAALLVISRQAPVSLPWQWPMAADTARAVRMARAWCGWTQREMARALGVRQETVSSWEQGRSIPLRRSWEGMVERMNIPLSVLSRWVTGKP